MGTMVLPEPLETLEARVCPPNRREWSNKDEDDGSRIGVMIGGFLAAEPFRSEAGFQGRVTSKLRGPDGPEFGAVQRMKYIMGATMVKHG